MKNIFIAFVIISCAVYNKPTIDLNKNIVIKITTIDLKNNIIAFEIQNNNTISVYLKHNNIMFLSNLTNSDGEDIKMQRFVDSQIQQNFSEFMEIKPKEKIIIKYKTYFFLKFKLIKGQEYILNTSYSNYTSYKKNQTLIGIIKAKPYKFKY